jgi:hypothetical protein
MGYYIALYREPTGPSAGTLPPFHGERSAMQKFDGNKAHSNAMVTSGHHSVETLFRLRTFIGSNPKDL